MAFIKLWLKKVKDNSISNSFLKYFFIIHFKLQAELGRRITKNPDPDAKLDRFFWHVLYEPDAIPRTSHLIVNKNFPFSMIPKQKKLIENFWHRIKLCQLILIILSIVWKVKVWRDLEKSASCHNLTRPWSLSDMIEWPVVM